MTYAELVARLARARRFGVRLGLERMTAALARLGEPARGFPAIQIGGTNGKGSTAAFTAAVLSAAGLRVGLYTSPHLLRLSERFRVDGEEMPDDQIAAAGAEVFAAVDAAGDGDELTFFEWTTLIALVGFRRRAVDVAVLEVGLGGRLDATTAVAAEVAGVTGVALDHQAVLGDTLAAIAGEKAGIFRPGQRAVIGAAGESAGVPLLVAAARAAGVASLAVIDHDAIARVGADLGLAGPHQRANAACALALVDGFEAARGIRVSAAARDAGLARARLAGRLDVIERDQIRYVIDGAHNPHAAATLAAALGRPAGGRRALVLAVSSDKDARGVAAPLVADLAGVVVCQVESDRALERSALAAIVGQVYRGPIDVAGSTAAALDRAAEVVGRGGEVVVAGSLFLAGEARRHLAGEPADAVPLADPAAGMATGPGARR